MNSRAHDATELEFTAKAINDLLAKRLPDRKLQFISFVMDEGEHGYLGYIASSNRVDAVAVILEWLERMFDSFNREQIIELLHSLEAATAEQP